MLGALTRVGAVATLALAAACGDPGPRLAPLAADAIILAFGDSLTAGTGAAPRDSYPARLADLTGRTVINAGRPGETSGEGLARLPTLLERHRPVLVILCHGGNDILRGLDRRRAEDNLRAMVERSRASGAEVVLVGVPDRGILLDTADWYERLASDLSLVADNAIIAEVLATPALKSDSVHPNADGYARIAQRLADLLGRAGAL